MPEVESARYSYVRYSYEVEPTEPLRQYLTLIEEIMNGLMPSDDFAVLNSPSGQEAKLIPIKLQPYPVGKLRFTMFEQRLPRSDSNNRKLYKLFDNFNKHKVLHDKLSQIVEAAGLEEGAGPEATFHSVKETTHPLDSHLGREYGLVATQLTTGVAMLLEMAGVYYEVGKSTGLGNEIIDGEPPEDVTVPFARLPRGTSDADAKAFLAAADRAVPGDGIDIFFSQDITATPNLRQFMR